MTQVDGESLQEFRLEAVDLLDQAETSLLALDRGEPFDNHYNAVFRVFHSIKGAAGMLGLSALQAHMHQVETLLQTAKARAGLSKTEIDFFLRGTDAARQILDGKPVAFDYRIQEGAAPVKRPQPSAEAPSPAARQDSLTGRAVVVDDEPEIVEIICEQLRDGGFEAFGYTEAEKALREMKSKAPTVVLTDINMPKMDGYAFQKACREVDPELPVIFVTGKLTKEGLIAALSNGIFMAIEKPFEQKQLLSAAVQATHRYTLLRLLTRTINMVMYQFSDLDDFLKSQGKDEQRQLIQNEIASLKRQRRLLLETR